MKEQRQSISIQVNISGVDSKRIEAIEALAKSFENTLDKVVLLASNVPHGDIPDLPEDAEYDFNVHITNWLYDPEDVDNYCGRRRYRR